MTEESQDKIVMVRLKEGDLLELVMEYQQRFFDENKVRLSNPKAIESLMRLGLAALNGQESA